MSDEEEHTCPPMYVPSEMIQDIDVQRQSRYPETPLHSHEEEDESSSRTSLALYFLLVVIIVGQFYMLNQLQNDLNDFQSEMFVILQTISKQIKPTTWQIVELN